MALFNSVLIAIEITTVNKIIASVNEDANRIGSFNTFLKGFRLYIL